MDIGIVGAGQIGGTLAKRLVGLGHNVAISNSRGPHTLADVAAQSGASPVTAEQAVKGRDIVIFTIPMKNVPDARALFAGVPHDTIVIDTNNYYPRQRDGRIEPIERGMTEGRWVSEQLGRPTVKTFNNINWTRLLNNAQPQGTPGRIAIPVAGDDAAAKAKVLALVDQLGFDGVDAGGLDDSWRQEPKTPCYGADLPADRLKEALAAAKPGRHPDFTGRPGEPTPGH